MVNALIINNDNQNNDNQLIIQRLFAYVLFC